MKKKVIAVLSIFFLLIIIVPAQGHSGRTDASGGHHDYKNKSGLGPYHYHHGCPAHLHPNGVCPYDAPAPVPQPAPKPQPKPIKVTVNGEQLQLSTEPIIVSGTTLVPFRAITESLGATVEWEPNTRMAIATKKNTRVVLVEGSASARVDGVTKKIGTPCQIVNGVMMVPARFIAESFGAEVNWDNATRTVAIDT